MKENTLFDIRYLPLKITLVSLKQAHLPPYLGSTLRGVIGQSLYKIDREAYEFIYVNGKKSEGKQDIVKPYVIIPPEASGTKKIIEKDETLTFEFIIFGTAIEFAPALVKALQNINQFGIGAYRYPFTLASVINRDNQRIIWWKEEYYGAGMNAMQFPCHMLSDVTGVVVIIRTPLRIRRNGQLLMSISFQTLIRNIVRRIEAITERYGNWVDKEEAEKIYVLAAQIEMTNENLRLEHLERYSNRME